MNKIVMLFTIGVTGCDNNPCKHGATCVIEGNTYKCSCAAGYTGVDCETGVSLLLKVQTIKFIC